MALHVNGWGSNWCSCYQAFSFEDTIDIDLQTVVGVAHPYNKTCPEHSGLSFTDRYYALRNESQRQSYTLFDIKSNFTDLSELDLEGQLVFKKGISANLSWTGTGNNRILHITISGYTLTNQQKNNLQSIADSKFGVGKVVFD